jgi:ribosome assembly protein 4
MATLLPPPKRQKVYHGVPEPEPEPPKPISNVVVQFVSDEDGEALAPAVNLPANLSREALESLVNKLNTKVSPESMYVLGGENSFDILRQDDEPVPFAFHITLPADAAKSGAPTQIAIAKSIEEDVLSHPSNAFTPEDILIVRCSPQAVFRVRPATRCSSTLSGASKVYKTWAVNLMLCRPYVSYPLCVVFPYWQPTSYWIG